MDGSLDEIWNIPTTPRSPSREHEQQSGQPLFLRGSDHENDEMPDAPPRRTDPQVDIEALFSGVDDLPEGPGDGSRAPALTPHQILSSSPAHHLDDGDNGQGEKDKDAKKPKKKIMRLDEGRLIGDSGFPQLMQDTKNVKIKGKGHEARLSLNMNCLGT
jgi:replication fork protection complex subunit Csm3/Swi3